MVDQVLWNVFYARFEKKISVGAAGGSAGGEGGVMGSYRSQPRFALASSVRGWRTALQDTKRRVPTIVSIIK